MQNIVPYLYYAYAVLLVGGGAMGSKVSGKSSSLIGSAVFAAVAVAAALLARSNPRAGLILGLVNTLAVTGFFIYRYTETQKPMPAFPAIGMSLILAVLTGLALFSLTSGTAQETTDAGNEKTKVAVETSGVVHSSLSPDKAAPIGGITTGSAAERIVSRGMKSELAEEPFPTAPDVTTEKKTS